MVSPVIVGEDYKLSGIDPINPKRTVVKDGKKQKVTGDRAKGFRWWNKSGNRINSAKIVFGGVAPIPWIDEDLNSMLNGMELSDKSIEAAGAITLEEAEPMEKIDYKIPLARNLVKKVLKDLRG